MYNEEMNRTIIVALVVVLALLAGYFFLFASKKSTITNYPSSGTDIVAFGDSLVEGYGASQGKDFVTLLSQDIGKPIVNLGVAGDTSKEGLARLNQLDSYYPKVVILLLGGNDAIQKVPPAQTFENLANIIVNIQSRGAIVLLVGVRGGVLSDPYASQFKKLADTYHTAYVTDALSGLFANKQYMYDEVHPNDAGYAILAGRIEPVLKSLLQ